eukprot:15033-Heterococcus_DN1.PRE.3
MASRLSGTKDPDIHSVQPLLSSALCQTPHCISTAAAVGVLVAVVQQAAVYGSTMHAMIVTVREAHKQYAASARSYDSSETIAYVRAVHIISDLQSNCPS